VPKFFCFLVGGEGEKSFWVMWKKWEIVKGFCGGYGKERE